MSHFVTFSKFLLVVIFLASGTVKLVGQDDMMKQMISSGLRDFKEILLKVGPSLPELFGLDSHIGNPEFLLQVIGVVMALSALLIIAGYRFPGYFLSTLLISFNFLIHWPKESMNTEMKAFNIKMIIQNTAILGGLLMVASWPKSK